MQEYFSPSKLAAALKDVYEQCEAAIRELVTCEDIHIKGTELVIGRTIFDLGKPESREEALRRLDAKEFSFDQLLRTYEMMLEAQRDVDNPFRGVVDEVELFKAVASIFEGEKNILDYFPKVPVESIPKCLRPAPEVPRTGTERRGPGKYENE